MRRRAFFAALLAPAVPALVASGAVAAPAYAEPFHAYNRESFWDLQDSGGALAMLVAAYSCTNAAGLDGTRRALGQLASEGACEVLEARWEEVAADFAQEWGAAPGSDEVRVVVYRDGALVDQLVWDGDANRLVERLRHLA